MNGTLLQSVDLCCCSSSWWLTSERQQPDIHVQGRFFFCVLTIFLFLGPCNVSKTHCQEQCQEKEDVWDFHRVRAAAEIAGGKFRSPNMCEEVEWEWVRRSRPLPGSAVFQHPCFSFPGNREDEDSGCIRNEAVLRWRAHHHTGGKLQVSTVFYPELPFLIYW